MHLRFLPIAALLASCTVDRSVPRDRFACDSGGPCAGGGPGFQLPPSCARARLLPASGVALGDTTLETDHAEGSCARPGSGGRDVLYALEIPVPLEALRIDTAQALFDTLIYLDRDQCDREHELTCDDDGALFWGLSAMTLSAVAAGRYFITVDGASSGAAGRFTLSVQGTIARGGSCAPDLPFLRCEVGQVCAPDGAAFRCQDVLDCPDGVDNDGDGMTDEDACDAPPDVKCPEPGTFPPFDLVTLAATASGAHPLIAREFELAAAPSTAFPTWLVEDHAGTAFLLPILSGPYVTRFTAVDALRQARACLATTTMDTGGDLRVELYWTGDLSARLRPHLLSAEARWWFDPAQDCEVGGACTAGLPWDTGGGGGDPTADAELPAPGPEVVHVAHPTPGARYRVGVHVFASHGSTAARVRISCGGHLARELGPVVLGPGEEGAPGNAFWKVADVAFSAPSCDVSPLGDGLQVTTTASAAQAR